MKLYYVNYGAPIGWVQVMAEGPSQAATHHSIVHLLGRLGNHVQVWDASRFHPEWHFVVDVKLAVSSIKCIKGRNV